MCDRRKPGGRVALGAIDEPAADAHVLYWCVEGVCREESDDELVQGIPIAPGQAGDCEGELAAFRDLCRVSDREVLITEGEHACIDRKRGGSRECREAHCDHGEANFDECIFWSGFPCRAL